MFSDLLTGLRLLETNPLSTYALLAALLLTGVSLAAGWARKDFLPLLRAKRLVLLGAAVLAAVLLAHFERSLGVIPASPALHGLSRLPLYLLALAYGPSFATLATTLFCVVVTGRLPSGTEAALVLELALVGWLAIAPSAFLQRWAGPFNVLLAVILSWASAGTVLLEQLGYNSRALTSYWQFHRSALPGISVSMTALLLLSPAFYRRVFADSRIGPWQNTNADRLKTREQRAWLLRRTRAALTIATDTPVNFLALPRLTRSRSKKRIDETSYPAPLSRSLRPKQRRLEPLKLPPLA